MKFLRLLVLIFLCWYGLNTQTKNIIFDLGGVVFTADKFAAFQQIGMPECILYTCWHLKNPKKIQNVMYQTMETVMPWPTGITSTKPQDDNGNEIPYIMYCWLTGKMSTQKIKDTLIPAINLHLDWFANKTEQTLIRNTVAMIFTPKTFIQTQQINPTMVSFIKNCKKAGHKIYVLSNWDPESFALLQRTHKDLFDLFDGIVISGNTGNAKPDTIIYRQLLQKYNLQAHDCYFLDDQQVNISAAKTCGINGILFNEKNLQRTTFA
jgi:HAD superfamily hydrolase (TIGR01509 family)